ncbi:MAG: hypothetical protein PHU95_03560 [Candidatus Thermoplasmatota archaeon]|nr:hypothetical protein [Candidatus Thermoplasmatota archaeon]MDD5778505.1 hypothetical protein [Candidatus Thermoplasmatota archaeon]
MGRVGKSTLHEHRDGGGQLHIPKSLWEQYDLQHGDKVSFYRPGPRGLVDIEGADPDRILYMVLPSHSGDKNGKI